jgi:hypothetical protein
LDEDIQESRRDWNRTMRILMMGNNQDTKRYLEDLQSEESPQF